jgi:hypothetical protein
VWKVRINGTAPYYALKMVSIKTRHVGPETDQDCRTC